MANLKGLAKDTAIYGLSSIVGRFLNYLLVPLYTNIIKAESGGYGIITNIYAYTAFFLVILTFGMETTFFRFANKDEENPDTVFSTSFGIVSFLTVLFMAGVFIFINPISNIMGENKEYILIMAVVVGLDAIQAIPFSLLRYQKRPIKFACLKMLFIGMNIGLNLLYFVVLEGRDILYVFVLNLICTGLITFFFIPEFLSIKWKFDFALLKRMLKYSWPILLLGIAGILNQTFDKQTFPIIYTRLGGYTQTEANIQLGIYGACVKIAMIMAMITQAFRYAYEPIVFAESKDKDSKEYYASAMKYFIIFTLFAFLCVMGYIDILKNIIESKYHEGLKSIPIVMVAEIMMGIYFNLSFWYKLIDKTIWGAWFSLAGCSALIAVNIIFVPEYGYMACAWGGVVGYGIAMILSYIIGQKKNPIKYDLRSIAIYTLLTAILFTIMYILPDYVESTVLRLVINTILILAFAGHIIYHDLPVKRIPVLGKIFNKKQ